MELSEIRSLFDKHQEKSLSHRYITNQNIKPLIDQIESKLTIDVLGKSVLNDSIYGLKIGTGEKRILMWSQMHGNESTTTKAIFDLLNTLLNRDLEFILNACTLYIIPILNPDGAKAYTRINANKVDLNRDAQNLTQPESKILQTVFNNFKPHYCFNLHGQRTIFGAGKHGKEAIVSFLSPAQDEACTITENRKKSMEIIAEMDKTLQKIIPSKVGVYDDAFNLNCVGDTFQSKNVPTILFEAGHHPNDYARDKTRELIYISYVTALDYIAHNNVSGNLYEPYLNIPENEKCFYDIIIRNAKINNQILDIAIQYQEELLNNQVVFNPKVEKIEKLDDYYAHYEIDAKNNVVLDDRGNVLELGYENVFVIIDNKETSLIPK